MKSFYLLAVVLCFSCSSKDTQMCSCLEEGKQLNDFSAKMLTTDATEADLKKMKALKAKKTKACAPFQEMSGEEMLKRQKDCEEK